MTLHCAGAASGRRRPPAFRALLRKVPPGVGRHRPCCGNAEHGECGEEVANPATGHDLAPFGLQVSPLDVGGMPDRRQYRLVRITIRNPNGRDPCACSPSSRAQPVRLRRRGRSALRRPRVQIRPAIPHPVAEAVEGRSVPAHAVAVHEVQSRCRRIASRAKMRAVAALRAEEVGAMNAVDDHVSCHRYARLRSHRTGGATDPLPFRVSQDLGPLSTAGHPAARRKPARHSCQGRHVGNSSNRSNVRTHAQSRAELEPSSARVPYIAGCEFSRPPALRTAALQSKSKRCRVAYGAGHPHSPLTRATSAKRKNRFCDLADTPGVPKTPYFT